MKIILSSAKTMQEDASLAYRDLPVYISEAEDLLDRLRRMTHEERKAYWKCSEKLTQANDRILFDADLRSSLTPAYACFTGTVFKHAAFTELDEAGKEYMQAHIRILSGLYGILKPYDGIRAYRMEMGSSFPEESVYAFWDRKIRDALDGSPVIDLASAEYSRAVSRYTGPSDRYITVTFKEMRNGKLAVQATASKAARGLMAGWICRNQVSDPEELKGFSEGYRYADELSSPEEFVFVKGQL